MEPNNLTPPEVYLESAMRIADGDYSGENWSCCIVGYVEGLGFNSLESPLAKLYCSVFNPEGDSYTFAAKVSQTPEENGERENLRVLMLTLMAECWEDFR